MTRRDRHRLRTVAETSAGGMVVNAGHEAVVIGRRTRRSGLAWSLPKGHIEHGESAEEAAVREIEEETGITGRILAPLGSIDFWFVADDQRVHKTVQHFLLEHTGGRLCTDDHEVAAVAWVPLSELELRLSHADERCLVRVAQELLRGGTRGDEAQRDEAQRDEARREHQL